jgi:predicted transcriptional regulator
VLAWLPDQAVAAESEALRCAHAVEMDNIRAGLARAQAALAATEAKVGAAVAEVTYNTSLSPCAHPAAA